MIAIWTNPRDTPSQAVLAALRRRGSPAILLDETTLQDVDKNTVGVNGRQVKIRDISALYVRPTGSMPLPLLVQFAETAPVVVVNRFSAGRSNASKPYQAALIAAAGFDIPDTLLTTSPDAAREFVAEHRGEVIYKSISSVRSIVARWSAAAEARLAHLAHCPTQLQERLPPPDIRLHVVGSRVFGCEVHSNADDYRYAARAGIAVAMRETTVPDEIARRACRLTAALGLMAAGLDLRRRADGSFCCFEVNPSPAFTFYTPVARSIADALAEVLDQSTPNTTTATQKGM